MKLTPWLLTLQRWARKMGWIKFHFANDAKGKQTAEFLTRKHF